MSASDFERYEIEIDNPLYPIALKDMNEPPEKLYVIGNPSVLSAKSIAVTGTRRSSPYGKEASKIVANEALAASAMLNPYGLDVLSLPFKTIGTSDVATVAVPELKPMFSIVPVEAVILIVISVMPVFFHAKCLGFKKTVFSFETMMISGLLFLSLMTWRNELLLLGILMIVYSTWCWKLEPKCKVSSKMLSRIVLFSISVVALEFGAVLFYSTLSATDQKSISLERAFQAMREDGAVSGTAVLTDIDPGCRAELNGFKPYLDTRIEVFNGQNGQKNVLAEAGKALFSGSLSAICDDYGMDYAVLNYGINDVGIQDLKESGFKPVYSDNLTVCLKRSTV